MFSPTFRRLQVFVAVAEAGSFIGGAQRLSISRPSVSQHMRALERQVGFSLFVRRRGASSGLTDRGRRLYESSTDLLDRADRITQELSTPAPRAGVPRKRRTIRLAAHRFILNEILKTPLMNFAREHPEIELLLETGTYSEVIETLRDGTTDIGFFIAAGEDIEVPTERVGVEPAGFYVAPSHPLAHRSRVEAAELCTYPFVTARPTSRSGQMLERLLGPLGVTGYPIYCQTAEDDVTREFALAGLGVSIFFSRSAASDVAARRLIQLPVAVPEMKIELHQAFSPWRRTDQATRQLARYLQRKHAFR